MTTVPARRPGPDLSTVELDALLKRLHLANMRHVHTAAIARAETEQWSYRDFLALLVAEEVAHRTQTRLQRLTRRAHFPYLKTIEDFDFTLQSQLRLSLLGSYLAPDFVTDGRSLILHGKTGRGKTHLSVAIAYRAIQHGFDALFTTAAELIEDLSNAGRKGRLHEALGRYTHPHVLVIDEVGYLTYGPEAANVLYHVVNDRHLRKRPMVFTTNKPMHDWGRVLHDPDLASAILDRVLERGRWITLDGPSGRTKHLKLDPAIPQDGPGATVSGKLVPEFPEPTSGSPAITQTIAGALMYLQFAAKQSTCADFFLLKPEPQPAGAPVRLCGPIISRGAKVLARRRSRRTAAAAPEESGQIATVSNSHARELEPATPITQGACMRPCPCMDLTSCSPVAHHGYMGYRDRAVSAVQSAERRLREDLRPIILEAIAADAYADVASIARIAEALSVLLRRVASDDYGAESASKSSFEELLGSGRSESASANGNVADVSAVQKLLPRGISRRDHYPRFLRDGERLVKVAWSKKERAPYEHRAPRGVVQALIAAVQKKKGEGKVFQAVDVMPLRNASHEEFPSYQSYLALNWLRDAGVINKKGQEGYVLKPGAATAEKLDRLWVGLPVMESPE